MENEHAHDQKSANPELIAGNETSRIQGWAHANESEAHRNNVTREAAHIRHHREARRPSERTTTFVNPELIAPNEKQTFAGLPNSEDHYHAPRRGSEAWFPKRRASSVVSRDASQQPRPSAIELVPAKTRWWKLNLREWDDDREQDWWFASTAIPLVAATIGPLANVLSICALVTSWRMCLVDGVDSKSSAACLWNGNSTLLVGDLEGVPFADPRWCYWINVVSLIMGFVGNLFLLLNFTGRVRYIVALPATILLWYLATALLIGITVSMDVYVSPVRPQQTYTQGFWHGVLAAILYLICSMLLMINMLGYFLGHYPQRFSLTESQQTLILQTMMFFIYLAGGGAIFSRVESAYGNGTYIWSYTNAVYYCDVTILTVGFGDIVTTSNIGRGLIFPYAVGGIITLGLMISSISKFASEIGSDKVVEKHLERSRVHTVGRAVTSSLELERRKTMLADGARPIISAPLHAADRMPTLKIDDDKEGAKNRAGRAPAPIRALGRAGTFAAHAITPKRKPRILLLREEKDRFDTMRAIQRSTTTWKRWTALAISVTAFGILWCIGAVVFWQAEQKAQSMTYFEALYFCYVSLLTIGYGDFAPKSNLGRAFFIVWSLIAVPTMTILISDMGDTIINNFNEGTNSLAELTVLPKAGVWRSLIDRMPALRHFLESRKDRQEIEKRLERGFETGPREGDGEPPTLDELAAEDATHPSDFDLARKLAQAIRRVANDIKEEPGKSYKYEEWVDYTRLIRFTSHDKPALDGDHDNDEEDLIEWDWIGENSPMMAKETESEFILDRLCESMGRYIRRLSPEDIPKPAARESRRVRDRSVGRTSDRRRSVSPPSRSSPSPSTRLSGDASEKDSLGRPLPFAAGSGGLR